MAVIMSRTALGGVPVDAFMSAAACAYVGKSGAHTFIIKKLRVDISND